MPRGAAVHKGGRRGPDAGRRRERRAVPVRAVPVLVRSPAPRAAIALLAIVAVVVATGALLLPGFGVVRAFEGLLLLILPGAALAWATLAPDRRDAGVTILAAGFSLVLLPLGGLLMNLVPVGLGAFSWLGAGAVVLGIAGLTPAGRALRVQGLPRPTLPRLWPVLTYGAAAVLLVAALWIARTRADQFDEHFTQLWLVATAQGEDVQVGIRNMEGVTTTYRVEVTAEDGVVQSWPDIVVPTGTAWTATLASSTSSEGVVQARLYVVGGSHDPYRTATLSRIPADTGG